MNKTLLTAALAGLISGGIAAASSAADESAQEKCYGITKAGANACAAADGSHSCAGQATKDGNPSDWKMVPAGECVKDGGKTLPGK
jgi:uncharacterized membrane protein